MPNFLYLENLWYKSSAMLTDVLQEAQRFQSLQEALGWALAKLPPIEIINVVTQDEYTHDVVFRIADDGFLVFDTT